MSAENTGTAPARRRVAMVRALVTGATGFIGRHLVERLTRDGVAVRCLVRDSRRAAVLQPLGAHLVRGDVTDPESLTAAVTGVDVVHHLAGLTLAFSASDFVRVNDAGTANLAAACSRAETPPVVVCVSSLAAAGPSPYGVARREEDAPAPVSNYGRSKRAGELRLAAVADRVPSTVLRPPIVFGPRERYLLALFRWVRRGCQPVPYFGPARLSLVHVHDLVEAMVRAAACGRRLVRGEAGNSPATGVYHVGCPERLTMEELGDRVAAALGRGPVRRVRIPPWVCRSLAAVTEVGGRLIGRQHLLNADKLREAAAGSWTCAVERAAEELGFRPAAPLAERLRQTAEWYRDNGWL